MFTGIVAAIGKIAAIKPIAGNAAGDVRLVIDAPTFAVQDVALGDSIAVNGTCLTVEQKSGTSFEVYASQATLSKTVGLNALGDVNLEKALTLQMRVGGHLVTGHVDGIGTVVEIAQVSESWMLVVRVAKDIAKFFAAKGSITINGVSLTVNRVADHAQGCDVEVNLIPHTWHVTTLHQLKVGSKVNVEIDLIARYLERMMVRR